MSDTAVRILSSVYGAEERKLTVIPHGIPNMPFVNSSFYKDEFAMQGRQVLLTFGFLSPGKGLEYVIEALPALVATHPDLIYVIIGATHSNVQRTEGESLP